MGPHEPGLAEVLGVIEEAKDARIGRIEAAKHQVVTSFETDRFLIGERRHGDIDIDTDRFDRGLERLATGPEVPKT